MNELTEKQRTALQNRCMWKYFDEASVACNNEGVTVPMVIDALKENGIDMTPKFMEILWRFIMKTKFGHESTTSLSTVEVKEVYEEVNRILSIFGLSVEWPSWDSVIYRENNK